MEDSLVQSQLNFETFFETVSDLIFVLDENGNVVHVNEAVIKRLDFLENELLEIPIFRILDCEQPKSPEKFLNSVFSGERAVSGISLLSKKREPIEVETVAFKGEWNSRPAIFWISRDVTELRLSERKIFHCVQFKFSSNGYFNSTRWPVY